jgi:hypothetical protein
VPPVLPDLGSGVNKKQPEAADPLRRGDGLGFFVDDGREVVTMGISLEV